MRHTRQFVLLLIAVFLSLAILMSGWILYKVYSADTPPSNILPTLEKFEGATARCKDGYYSYATHYSGACSSHGGLVEKL